MPNVQLNFTKQPLFETRKDRIGQAITKLDDMHASTLTNICNVAAERFRENAEQFRKLIDYMPKPADAEPDADGRLFVDMTPHGDGARRLAEQFDDMAKEAKAFSELFAEAEHIEVVNPEDSEVADEAA